MSVCNIVRVRCTHFVHLAFETGRRRQRHQSTRSLEAALAVVGKEGIDVDTEVLWRRARLSRRAWHVRPASRERIHRDSHATLVGLKEREVADKAIVRWFPDSSPCV